MQNEGRMNEKWWRMNEEWWLQAVEGFWWAHIWDDSVDDGVYDCG